jgi:hypothetical protein
MNKVIIYAKDREGSVMPQTGDFIVTALGSTYLKTYNGYANLTDGHYTTNEQFVGKIKQIIRGATIEITEYGFIG